MRTWKILWWLIHNVVEVVLVLQVKVKSIINYSTTKEAILLVRVDRIDICAMEFLELGMTTNLCMPWRTWTIIFLGLGMSTKICIWWICPRRLATKKRKFDVGEYSHVVDLRWCARTLEMSLARSPNEFIFTFKITRLYTSLNFLVKFPNAHWF